MKIHFFLLLIVLVSISCNNLTTSKNKTLPLDTIIDYTKVDVSPAFISCDHLEGSKKSACFENELRVKVYKELHQHDFFVREDINETVVLTIQITSKGKINLKKIQSSSTIKSELPELEEILKKTIENMPVIIPAFKKGIPVVTEYTLPIKVANL